MWRHASLPIYFSWPAARVDGSGRAFLLGGISGDGGGGVVVVVVVVVMVAVAAVEFVFVLRTTPEHIL